MTKREYDRAVRRLNDAYAELAVIDDALEAVGRDRTFFDRETLWKARQALRQTEQAVQRLACKTCGGKGSYAKPDDPYTGYQCRHDDVPAVFPK